MFVGYVGREVTDLQETQDIENGRVFIANETEPLENARYGEQGWQATSLRMCVNLARARQIANTPPKETGVREQM